MAKSGDTCLDHLTYTLFMPTDLLEPNPKYTASITQYIIDVCAHPYNLVCQITPNLL